MTDDATKPYGHCDKCGGIHYGTPANQCPPTPGSLRCIHGKKCETESCPECAKLDLANPDAATKRAHELTDKVHALGGWATSTEVDSLAEQLHAAIDAAVKAAEKRGTSNALLNQQEAIDSVSLGYAHRVVDECDKAAADMRERIIVKVNEVAETAVKHFDPNVTKAQFISALAAMEKHIRTLPLKGESDALCFSCKKPVNPPKSCKNCGDNEFVLRGISDGD